MVACCGETQYRITPCEVGKSHCDCRRYEVRKFDRYFFVKIYLAEAINFNPIKAIARTENQRSIKRHLDKVIATRGFNRFTCRQYIGVNRILARHIRLSTKFRFDVFQRQYWPIAIVEDKLLYRFEPESINDRDAFAA